LRQHLEAQFVEGMSWQNYGTHGWQVDHIAPLASTDDFYERLKLYHYTNLQPLWAKHNQQKSAKVGWRPHDDLRHGSKARAIETLRITTGEGEPFSAEHARRKGISSALLSHHEKRGNLLRLGRGFFMFPGEALDPLCALALLTESMPDLHIGAEAALLWHARNDARLLAGSLVVVSQARKGLPTWLTTRDEIRFVGRSAFAKGSGLYLQSIERKVKGLKGASCSERELALLEVLHDVGVRLSAERARDIVSKVVDIDAPRLSSLLKATDRVKLHKLCAIWPSELGLPWAKDLMQQDWMPLGARKRWVRVCVDGKRLTLGPIQESSLSE
jgi:hypothetical protein